VDYYYLPRQLHYPIAVDDLNLYILHDLTLKKEWTTNSYTTVLYLNLDSTIKEETIYLDKYYIQDMLLCYHLSSGASS
jgi:hypothetical protein